MGMFDDIHCDYPLPDGCQEKRFQTKDLDCQLDLYTMTAEGRLLKEEVDRYEPIPESEWTYVDATGLLEQHWHELSKRRPIFIQRDTNFHGILNFYTSTGSNQDGTIKWYEYEAKFTDGVLVEITRLPDEDDIK